MYRTDMLIWSPKYILFDLQCNMCSLKYIHLDITCKICQKFSHQSCSLVQSEDSCLLVNTGLNLYDLTFTKCIFGYRTIVAHFLYLWSVSQMVWHDWCVLCVHVSLLGFVKNKQDRMYASVKHYGSLGVEEVLRHGWRVIFKDARCF